MKTIDRVILPLFIAAALYSCDDIECDHIVNIETDQSFIGTWYDAEMNEEFRVFENGTYYDKYSNTMLNGETEGRWSYDKENKRFTETYEFTGQVRFIDWKIVSLTDFSFVIQSDLNGTGSLSKVVESFVMEPGEQQQIMFSEVYPEYNVRSYSSTNDRIASVTDDGLITANGAKGTAYVKIETESFDVWAKVLVGDDCLDLWYNYESLINCDYQTMCNRLGKPSIYGEDGYSFGYSLSIHPVLAQVEFYMNQSNSLVETIALVLRKDFPESVVLSYMNSHYYRQSAMGADVYSDNSTLSGSSVYLDYDRKNSVIYIYDTSYFKFPDYTYTFGYTTQQIVDEFGELYYGMALYDVSNYYAVSVYFSPDEITDRITSFMVFLSENLPEEQIHSQLSERYKNLKTSDGQYGYYNANSIQDATIMAIYRPENATIIYYDMTSFASN